MKVQTWSKSGLTKTRSDRWVPDPCDVIGLSVLKGLIERTNVSAVIAMNAVQIASCNFISGRILSQVFATEDGIQHSLVIMKLN